MAAFTRAAGVVLAPAPAAARRQFCVSIYVKEMPEGQRHGDHWCNQLRLVNDLALRLPLQSRSNNAPPEYPRENEPADTTQDHERDCPIAGTAR